LSSSSEKQRDGRVLQRVLVAAIDLCSVANVWFAATIVDLPQQHQQQPPQEQGSFRMNSKNKRLDSRKWSRTPHKTHPHVSSIPATVSKPVNEDASHTATAGQTASKRQNLTETTGKQPTTSTKTRTTSQQQPTKNIADLVLQLRALNIPSLI
jgi:cytoskeletal protein RodZ